MFPRPALDAFFPEHLRGLMGFIESRVFPEPGERHPFEHVTKSHSLFDMTTRLPALIRDDAEVYRYLQWCIERFEDRRLITMYPPHERAGLQMEITALKHWLATRTRTAIGPARL